MVQYSIKTFFAKTCNNAIAAVIIKICWVAGIIFSAAIADMNISTIIFFSLTGNRNSGESIIMCGYIFNIHIK